MDSEDRLSLTVNIRSKDGTFEREVKTSYSRYLVRRHGKSELESVKELTLADLFEVSLTIDETGEKL